MVRGRGMGSVIISGKRGNPPFLATSRFFLASLAALLVGVVVLCSGCSSGYLMRAAFEQSKILLGRKQIQKVIGDPETPQEQRQKLEVVLEARSFAQVLGLDPGGSFTKYSAVDRDPLAWVVVGSKRDAFALRLWWFPIVGSVPYKGFFEKDEALAEAADLLKQGFETSVRGTEAFSTLGWFNDPVLSTTLKNPVTRIVNTVIHESVHSTVWIKNNVAFNESLANFVGTEGALAYFKAKSERCRRQGSACDDEDAKLKAAAADRLLQYDLSALMGSLYADLQQLYADNALSSEEKIQRRVAVFDRHLIPFRERYPKLLILKEVNNAEIVQFKLYLTDLLFFWRLFEREGGTWDAFLRKIREIERVVDEEPRKDPFEVLRSMVGDLA
jgi:predicted aminopeptidase